MLTSAIEFFSRFPRMPVYLASFDEEDKAVLNIAETMSAAYDALYGNRNSFVFQIVKSHEESVSIFNRMFPINHFHVAVSSRDLEWLSKVPEEVIEKGWNKRKVWIEGADPRVVRAYAKQADKDLFDFLTCRKAELKMGGSLFMMMGGRPSGSGASQFGDNDSSLKHLFTTYMDRAWQVLIDQDGLPVEKRDGFNIPMYLRSQEEIEAAIMRCGGFKIEKMVNLKIADRMNETPMLWIKDPSVYGKFRASFAKAAAENLMKDYLGDERMTAKLFRRYEEVAAADKNLMVKDYFSETIAVSATRV